MIDTFNRDFQKSKMSVDNYQPSLGGGSPTRGFPNNCRKCGKNHVEFSAKRNGACISKNACSEMMQTQDMAQYNIDLVGSQILTPKTMQKSPNNFAEGPNFVQVVSAE